MRRFESCPHSQESRGRLLVEGPSPTKRCSRVRSSTPVPTFRSDRAPVAERIQASLCFSIGAQRQRASCAPRRYTLVRVQPGVPCRGRSVAGRRSLKPSTLVRFQPSVPRLCWRGVRCTGGLINRFAPDQSKGRVRLPAPEPIYSGRLQRLRGLSYKQVLQGSTPWPATIPGR